MEQQHEAVEQVVDKSEQPNESQWEHLNGKNEPHQNLKRRLTLQEQLNEVMEKIRVGGKPVRLQLAGLRDHLRLKIAEAETHSMRGKRRKNANR